MKRMTEPPAQRVPIACSVVPGVLLALGLGGCDRDGPSAPEPPLSLAVAAGLAYEQAAQLANAAAGLAVTKMGTATVSAAELQAALSAAA